MVVLDYHSISELVTLAEAAGKKISELCLADQAEALGQSRDEVYERMRHNLLVMKEAAEQGADENIRSSSGLSGGGGFKMLRYATEGKPLSGAFCAQAAARALAVAEYNAAMGRIVAAPTAGSCGILPGAVLTMMDLRGSSEDDAVMALFTAGAFGMVIAGELGISGAEAGCQAECGAAASIAAAALAEMAGGSPSQAAAACALALKNLMGLVCDPVAGLVEVPCVKRNAAALFCAIASADMALAGLSSAIPPDEVISALAEVGAALPGSLRETAQGGLAVTPTGQAIKQRLGR